MCTLGDGYDASLGEPAQGYLCSTLVVFRTDACQKFALHDAIHALSAQGSPCHHLCVELCKKRFDGCLLDEGVALQLVHHWLHVDIVGEVEEAASLEVAHAYGSSLAVAIGFLQSPPRAKHVAIGLMNEQQVDVVSLQLAQALVDALGGLLLARI